MKFAPVREKYSMEHVALKCINNELSHIVLGKIYTILEVAKASLLSLSFC